jgi:hypothetical protein
MYRHSGAAHGKLPRWGDESGTYPHGGAAWSQRGSSASFRLVAFLFLLSLVLGSTTVHKVFVCDPQLDAAAEREAQLLASLKRLQGSLALRATQGSDVPTSFTHGAASPGLTLADKVAYDRRVADKELMAQRAHRETAACEAQLLALAANVSAASNASGDAAVAAAAAAAAAAASAASHTEVKALRKAARAAESRAARAERSMVDAQLQLKSAKLELAQLSQRLRLPLPPLGRGQPDEGMPPSSPLMRVPPAANNLP